MVLMDFDVGAGQPRIPGGGKRWRCRARISTGVSPVPRESWVTGANLIFIICDEHFQLQLQPQKKE